MILVFYSSIILSNQKESKFLGAKRRNADLTTKTRGSERQVKGRVTWIASGGASGPIYDFEGTSENRGKGKLVVDTTCLDLAVNGGDSSRSRLSAGDIAPSGESWRHYQYRDILRCRRI